MPKNLPAKLTVLRAHQVTPHMRRVMLGGGGFDQLADGHRHFTDSYVKLVFLADGVDYPDPLDLDVVRETLPQEAWPVLRTYTLRSVDREAREVAIDFVVHGADGGDAEGLAAPWAMAAQPGDTIHLRGPGGAYAPDPEADHHLLVGDEAALPAIVVALESLPAGAKATAFVEVADETEEQPFATAGDVDVHWLHRGDAEPGTTSLLDDAVRAWDWPGGRVQVFVHGESSLLKSVRPYLVQDRGVARGDVSISAYWRRGETEEGFRAWKSQQKDAVTRPGR